jgi:hypothetical protein
VLALPELPPVAVTGVPPAPKPPPRPLVTTLVPALPPAPLRPALADAPARPLTAGASSTSARPAQARNNTEVHDPSTKLFRSPTTMRESYRNRSAWSR